MSVYAASIQPAQLRLGGELAIWSDTVAVVEAAGSFDQP